MEGPFSKSFSWQIEDTLLGVGAVLHGGLMISSCQRRGSFTNTFSVINFYFPNHRRDIHLQIKPWPKLWKYLYLKLIVKKFQRLCHVQSDLKMFVKLIVQIGDCIRKIPSALCLRGWGFHAKPAFLCNFLNGDL